jgi:hypothetical protein
MSTRSNPFAKLAMQNAWRLARQGWAIYGGPIRSYLGEALRLAWADLKAGRAFQAINGMLADMRARKRGERRAEKTMIGSPGMQAAADRWRQRHGARAYGGGFGSAKFTAGW